MLRINLNVKVFFVRDHLLGNHAIALLIAEEHEGRKEQVTKPRVKLSAWQETMRREADNKATLGKTTQGNKANTPPPLHSVLMTQKEFEYRIGDVIGFVNSYRGEEKAIVTSIEKNYLYYGERVTRINYTKHINGCSGPGWDLPKSIKLISRGETLVPPSLGNAGYAAQGMNPAVEYKRGQGEVSSGCFKTFFLSAGQLSLVA